MMGKSFLHQGKYGNTVVIPDGNVRKLFLRQKKKVMNETGETEFRHIKNSAVFFTNHFIENKVFFHICCSGTKASRPFCS